MFDIFPTCASEHSHIFAIHVGTRYGRIRSMQYEKNLVHECIKLHYASICSTSTTRLSILSYLNIAKN